MMNILKRLYHSMPVQLILLHIRKNQILLFCWLFLFLIVGNVFGSRLGIPWLFLDPEYVNEVSFVSFFIMGMVLAGFSTAFNITCYILDGVRFNFIATIRKPFTHFSINNSLIPLAFMIFYSGAIIQFQVQRQFASTSDILVYLSGLFSGYIAMTFLLYLYFRFTNNDIFQYLVVSVDRKLKEKVGLSRWNIMARLKLARDPKSQLPVQSYISEKLKTEDVRSDYDFYNKATILKVFDQNHLNLVLVQLGVFFMLILLGIFRDNPTFQIPAAASGVLLLTIMVMFAGALSYWFRGWTTTIVIAVIILLNFLVKEQVFDRQYYAYGLDYNSEPANYDLSTIHQLSSPGHVYNDKATMYQVLENWRSKFDEKPKMVFIAVSGGGQRAALWTLKALQAADSITQGSLMKNTMLISGASGGLIGAAYFRELYARSKQPDEQLDLYNDRYLTNISNDNLNPIIFSLLVNDLFINLQYFDYMGLTYPKDRGYAFERQININTGGFLDRPLSDYYGMEHTSTIPMLIMAPTIINDGRKLFISTHGVSFMTTTVESEAELSRPKVRGVDFRKLFMDQGADQLRFLSALRMSATFPYITPNISLPSSPPMEIMDAGISDNFGIGDAVRFLFAFRDWIAENTSGVIILSVRDSPRDSPVEPSEGFSMLENISKPIASVYSNFGNLQDLDNEGKIEYARSWFNNDLTRIDLQYVPENNLPEFENLNKDREKTLKEELIRRRASLSWRLTSLEKQNIIDNIEAPVNRQALMKLKLMLEE